MRVGPPRSSIPQRPSTPSHNAQAWARPGASFQFQRVGFFTVDKDATAAAPVFNRVVALKEDKGKGK